jgi:hypothetical protein
VCADARACITPPLLRLCLPQALLAQAAAATAAAARRSIGSGAAAASPPASVRGIVHGYVWTVVGFKARPYRTHKARQKKQRSFPTQSLICSLFVFSVPPIFWFRCSSFVRHSQQYQDESKAPLPRYDLRVVLEDGSGACAASLSHAFVASLLGRATPAALLADIEHADAAVQADVRTRLARLRELLQAGVGRLEVEVHPSCGEGGEGGQGGVAVTLHGIEGAARGGAGAAGGAPAAPEERAADALAAGWALLTRLRRNGGAGR